MIYIHELSTEQAQQIDTLLEHPEDDLHVQRLRIVLLSASGEDVPAISKAVKLHPINVRKWIHRYIDSGIDGLYSGKSPGRPSLFSPEQREDIIRIARANPRSMGLPFSRWSLKRLQRHLIDQRVVESISVETIRQIITNAGAVYGVPPTKPTSDN